MGRENFQERFKNPFHKTKYVEFHALNNLSFDVKKKRFLVCRANGAGKSTLLKIVLVYIFLIVGRYFNGTLFLS